MSTQRKPIRDEYDALLALGPWEGTAPTAYALVKQTFAIQEGRCVLAPPEPLLHDWRDESLERRLRPGTDFWPFKERTDFVVRGAAYAPGGARRSAMMVSARIGNTSKRAAVFGKRAIAWTPGGAPLIEDPEPFTSMPMAWTNAYGGVDRRVRPAGAVDLPQLVAAALDYDHPGAYPRNPFGKGYFVLPGPVADAEMPNIEDPGDLLNAERLVTGDPRAWYRQPLPACLDWMHPLMFPRFLWFGAGADAWFPAPDDDTMPEVRLGLLQHGYRGHRTQGVDPRFFQEAPLGLSLVSIVGDEEVSIDGMHPARPVTTFRLPGPPPRVAFSVEGKLVTPAVRTHSVIVEPAAERVSLVYGATVELPRPFIPEVHRHIPIAVRVNGDSPIAYDTPPTVRDQLAAAGGRS